MSSDQRADKQLSKDLALIVFAQPNIIGKTPEFCFKVEITLAWQANSVYEKLSEGARNQVVDDLLSCGLRAGLTYSSTRFLMSKGARSYDQGFEIACSKGHAAVVEAQLEDPSLHVTDMALFCASSAGLTNAVKEMLTRSNYKVHPGAMNLALIGASQRGKIDVVRVLMGDTRADLDVGTALLKAIQGETKSVAFGSEEPEDEEIVPTEETKAQVETVRFLLYQVVPSRMHGHSTLSETIRMAVKYARIYIRPSIMGLLRDVYE
jgi:hypothetical protein